MHIGGMKNFSSYFTGSEEMEKLQVTDDIDPVRKKFGHRRNQIQLITPKKRASQSERELFGHA